MSSLRTEFSRRAARGLIPAALLALAPKCLLCVVAYAGAGAALGLGGPEICGASEGAAHSWGSPLAWSGVAAGVGAFGFFVRCQRLRAAPSRTPNAMLS